MDLHITWTPLKDLKESNPVEVAEYAKTRGIKSKPAFAWRVPFTLRKRAVVISAVSACVRKTTHKYGIEIPTSVEHANVGVAFKILESGEHVSPEYAKSSGHLVFDVCMIFQCKTRWVKDDHKTPDPEISNCAGVVSQ